MLYDSLDSLIALLSQIDTTDKEQMEKLNTLFEVYTDALYNPPIGIIGVGAITYAENALIAFQLRKEEAYTITQTEESEGLDGFFEVLLANAKKGF